MTQLDLFAPAQRHSPTSRAAAAAMQPHLGAAQARVLEVIKASGERGLTDNDGIRITGMINGYRARRLELSKAGLIREVGTKINQESGQEAVLWRATPQPGSAEGG
jgi:hypothetical protein